MSRSLLVWVAVPAAVCNVTAQTQINADHQTPPADKNRIVLNVIVTDKKGQPISGLEAENFTLLDNGRPRQITTFRALEPETLRWEPAHVVIAIDAINSDLDLVAKERDQVSRFLERNDGRLSNPTTLAFLSDSGLKIDQKFTRNGNELDAALNKLKPALRTVDASTLGGVGERFNMSIGQFTELAAWTSGLPGRKLLLLISSGWPMLPGIENQSSTIQRQWLFNSIVKFTNGLRQFQVTVYSIDPFDDGTAPRYYQSFLKGVPSVNDAEYANLSLPVIAEHSGGQVVVGPTNILDELQMAVRNASMGYQLTFEASESDQPNTYHALQLRVNHPNIVVRTAAGYYADMLLK
jgi:VWFA-related protein